MFSRKRQSGVVIIMALFIVALVAGMSYVMMARLERDTYRLSLILRNMEAENIAQGSIAWAKDILITNYEKRAENQLVDKMPQVSPVMEEEGFSVASTLFDMQGRFNLNTIKTQEVGVDFARLILLVQPKIKKKEAEMIATSIMNWIIAGSNNDTTSKYYLNLRPPYRPHHAPMFNASELRLVKGVRPELYVALKPYVTALPDTALLNVQTMLPEVMVTLSPSMTLTAAKSIDMQRKQKPFVSVATFTNADIVRNHKVPEGRVTAESEYFLLETKVTIENQRTLLYTLLKRTVDKDKKSSVSIVWQSKGSW